MKPWIIIASLLSGCTIQMVGDQTRLDDLTTRMGKLEAAEAQDEKNWQQLGGWIQDVNNRLKPTPPPPKPTPTPTPQEKK